MDAIYNAVIYLRVSHGNRSISIEDQERECRAVCERNHWPVRNVFSDDGISASRYGNARPRWEELKKELRQGDVLVCWEASRAQRDLGEFVELRDLCSALQVPLSYSGRILDLSEGGDRFVGGLDALVAERESELIKVRVLRGKNSAAAAGHPSWRAPWGYLNKPRQPGDRPEWELDPVEAPRVRESVQRIIDGCTLYSVQQWLASTEGFTPSSITNLKRSLTNPALAGYRVHQKKVAGKGTWKPIITELQHQDLVDQLKSIPAEPRGREPIHLLTGLAKCGKVTEKGICGDGLRWKRYKGKRHPGYECYAGHCSREASAMDSAVVEKLFELIPVAAAAAAARVGDVTTASMDEARRKIEELEEKLEEWRGAAIKGDVTPSSFAVIEKGLDTQIEELRSKTRPKLRVPNPEALRKSWPGLSVRERRDYIRTWVTITVIPAERRGARTGQLLIEPCGVLGVADLPGQIAP